MRARFVHSVVALAALTVGATAGAYQLVDLGTLGGSSSFALDVNNGRQVTGNAQLPVGQPNPRLNTFLFSGTGPMMGLGVLPGSNNFSRGYAINDAGVVVGESDNNNSRAFVYRDGVLSGLTRLAGDNDRGVAHDINNAGTIVGISSNGTVSRPTRWDLIGSAYVPSDLGTLAGTPASTGRAWSISANGIVAGLSTSASGTSQATIWSGGSITSLGSLGDGTRFSQAFAVNSAGTAVGSSSTGQTVGQLIGTSSTTAITRAFAWSAGAITELPPVNLYTPTNTGPTTNYHSVANDISESGVVVGNSQRIAGLAAVATVWIDGVAIDLNSRIDPASGWVLTSAEGINDAGDIVGFGTFGGSTRAYLLVIPEPSSLALLLPVGLLLTRPRR
jgi:probable HAF family extracellular repeat protein